jgi:hypothetical protein
VRFSTPVQTRPGAHRASCTIGTASLPGLKRPGRGVNQPHPSSARVKERVQLYLHSLSVHHDISLDTVIVRAGSLSFGLQPLTADARVLSLISSCGIYSWQIGTDGGYSYSISVVPCLYHSISAPYFFIYW